VLLAPQPTPRAVALTTASLFDVSALVSPQHEEVFRRGMGYLTKL
jgi:hypothetical protein